ncbi:MAG: NAD-dependent protein deacylase [Clostridia bacterium]|nr:NAD-dependent protein deacylase [Clostridia bacterium]
MNELQRFVDEAENIVFFGGAGVSTASGIPDFRSQDGLYNTKYDYPPEQILSHGFFFSHTEEFFKFYADKMIFLSARPNAAHLKLAELERAGKLRAVVTQNIDGLHQAAGSKNVLELHGSVHRNYCAKCGLFHALTDILPIMQGGKIPRCGCGGIIKPDVVLYEEPLDGAVIEASVNAIAGADLIIVGGTSLNVYPAAGLLRYFKGSRIVLINKTEIPFDSEATLIYRDSIAEVLGKIKC